MPAQRRSSSKGPARSGAASSNRSGRKRAADATNDMSTASEQPTSKRFKTNTITDYMNRKSQSRSKQKANASTNAKPAHPSPEHLQNDVSNTSTQSQATKPSATNNSKTLALHESTGDIFAAPSNTLLLHACNCQGSWGAGIALAFKKHYPTAFHRYQAHCKASSPASLIGTALLIPAEKHFVGCLFTSKGKGKTKDSPGQILDATGRAVKDLLRQVREYNGHEGVGEVRMCKINSGLFGVPWGETRAVMEGIEVGEKDFQRVEVVSREE